MSLSHQTARDYRSSQQIKHGVRLSCRHGNFDPTDPTADSSLAVAAILKEFVVDLLKNIGWGCFSRVAFAAVSPVSCRCRRARQRPPTPWW
eukprot:6189801-Pleurochrysis_carterae.AAC.2